MEINPLLPLTARLGAFILAVIVLISDATRVKQENDLWNAGRSRISTNVAAPTTLARKRGSAVNVSGFT